MTRDKNAKVEKNDREKAEGDTGKPQRSGIITKGKSSSLVGRSCYLAGTTFIYIV